MPQFQQVFSTVDNLIGLSERKYIRIYEGRELATLSDKLFFFADFASDLQAHGYLVDSSVEPESVRSLLIEEELCALADNHVGSFPSSIAERIHLMRKERGLVSLADELQFRYAP